MQASIVSDNVNIEHIVPFYQPIFNLDTGAAVRYECLARLLDENQTVHLPNDFLYLVERKKFTAAMTKRMLEMSTNFFSPKQMRWSINMFAADLSDVKILRDMTSLCLDIDKGLCGIELSYDSVKDNLPALKNFIKQIPNLHISVDDVDECTDKLHAIIASGIDAIKLKGSLVRNFASTGSSKKVIECVRHYCDEYAVNLIAEHIEDQQTLEAVKSANIKYGQGFYLSSPQTTV
ncbi:EAL domain-containing protein [Agaribacter flavus]|uniref:EAL domain-containing protein n=1 Tax=Agaribacter flavus TaxID=1902781 RepID=A0ABV7FYK7_9ALTE